MVDKIKERPGFEPGAPVTSELRAKQRNEASSTKQAENPETAFRISASLQSGALGKGNKLVGDLRDALSLSDQALKALKRAADSVDGDPSSDVDAAENIADNLSKLQGDFDNQVSALRKRLAEVQVVRENQFAAKASTKDVDALVGKLQSSLQVGSPEQVQQFVDSHSISAQRVGELLAD